jgi:GSH-dependent disulfide-bond oxidoreductase
MIKLYFHTSPNPMKIVLFLEEVNLEEAKLKKANVPYQIVPVDTFKGEQHSPAYRAINPNARTPAIVQDGVRTFDSTAILLQLSEQFGRFQASATNQPEMLSWLLFIATGIAPMGGQLVHFTRVNPDVPYAQNRYRREVERLYGILDDRLKHSEFLAGAEYTIADISAWGWIRISDFVLGEGELARYSNLKAWFDRVDARPAAQRTREVAAKSNFKSDFDEETLRSMFPQNYPLIQK